VEVLTFAWGYVCAGGGPSAPLWQNNGQQSDLLPLFGPSVVFAWQSCALCGFRFAVLLRSMPFGLVCLCALITRQGCA
jgi:hypothetical protein